MTRIAAARGVDLRAALRNGHLAEYGSGVRPALYDPSRDTGSRLTRDTRPLTEISRSRERAAGLFTFYM